MMPNNFLWTTPVDNYYEENPAVKHIPYNPYSCFGQYSFSNLNSANFENYRNVERENLKKAAYYPMQISKSDRIQPFGVNSCNQAKQVYLQTDFAYLRNDKLQAAETAYSFNNFLDFYQARMKQIPSGANFENKIHLNSQIKNSIEGNSSTHRPFQITSQSTESVYPYPQERCFKNSNLQSDIPDRENISTIEFINSEEFKKINNINRSSIQKNFDKKLNSNLQNPKLVTFKNLNNYPSNNESPFYEITQDYKTDSIKIKTKKNKKNNKSLHSAFAQESYNNCEALPDSNISISENPILPNNVLVNNYNRRNFLFNKNCLPQNLNPSFCKEAHEICTSNDLAYHLAKVNSPENDRNNLNKNFTSNEKITCLSNGINSCFRKNENVNKKNFDAFSNKYSLCQSKKHSPNELNKSSFYELNNSEVNSSSSFLDSFELSYLEKKPVDPIDSPKSSSSLEKDTPSKPDQVAGKVRISSAFKIDWKKCIEIYKKFSMNSYLEILKQNEDKLNIIKINILDNNVRLKIKKNKKIKTKKIKKHNKNSNCMTLKGQSQINSSNKEYAASEKFSKKQPEKIKIKKDHYNEYNNTLEVAATDSEAFIPYKESEDRKSKHLIAHKINKLKNIKNNFELKTKETEENLINQICIADTCQLRKAEADFFYNQNHFCKKTTCAINIDGFIAPNPGASWPSEGFTEEISKKKKNTNFNFNNIKKLKNAESLNKNFFNSYENKIFADTYTGPGPGPEPQHQYPKQDNTNTNSNYNFFYVNIVNYKNSSNSINGHKQDI